MFCDHYLIQSYSKKSKGFTEYLSPYKKKIETHNGIALLIEISLRVLEIIMASSLAPRKELFLEVPESTYFLTHWFPNLLSHHILRGRISATVYNSLWLECSLYNRKEKTGHSLLTINRCHSLYQRYLLNVN